MDLRIDNLGGKVFAKLGQPVLNFTKKKDHTGGFEIIIKRRLFYVTTERRSKK